MKSRWPEIFPSVRLQFLPISGQRNRPSRCSFLFFSFLFMNTCLLVPYSAGNEGYRRGGIRSWWRCSKQSAYRIPSLFSSLFFCRITRSHCHWQLFPHRQPKCKTTENVPWLESHKSICKNRKKMEKLGIVCQHRRCTIDNNDRYAENRSILAGAPLNRQQPGVGRRFEECKTRENGASFPFQHH